MAGVKITHKITGVEQLKRRIRTINQGLPQLLSRAELADPIIRRIKERYLTERDPDLVRWKELSPRSKKGPQTLIQKGNLFKAIDYIGGTNQGKFASATGAGFRIGVVHRNIVIPLKKGGSRVVDPAVYGRAHQLGIGVPKRRFLGISELDVKSVDAKMRRALKRLVEGS